MMNTDSLAKQIDKLVRNHLEQVRAEAASAVERAFGASSTKARESKEPPRARSMAKRRDPSFIAELAERLHQRIVAEPGESMAVHARHLDVSAPDLSRPMTVLKQARRLRTTGARNSTRYYPTPGS